MLEGSCYPWGVEQKLVGEFFSTSRGPFWVGSLAGMLQDFLTEQKISPEVHCQPNGPAEVQCKFVGLLSGLNFGEFWGVNFSKVNFSGGLFCFKNTRKKFDTRIRVQNSGVQNSCPTIRPLIRVPEAQNPLRRLSSLIHCIKFYYAPSGHGPPHLRLRRRPHKHFSCTPSDGENIFGPVGVSGLG